MTEQDCRPGPARLAISGEDRYPRAGAHVDRDPDPTDPARAQFLAGQDGPPAEGPAPAAVTAPQDPSPTAAGGQPRRPNGRFKRYPLRRRAERLRRLGHADHDAADTLRDALAAGVDYARRVHAAADDAGMRDPKLTTAIYTAVDALMAAGDTGTTAMHTWSPDA